MGDWRKGLVAGLIRKRSLVDNGWLAETLQMGARNAVSRHSHGVAATEARLRGREIGEGAGQECQYILADPILPLGLIALWLGVSGVELHGGSLHGLGPCLLQGIDADVGSVVDRVVGDFNRDGLDDLARVRKGGRSFGDQNQIRKPSVPHVANLRSRKQRSLSGAELAEPACSACARIYRIAKLSFFNLKNNLAVPTNLMPEYFEVAE